ncbi:hypothetical protein VTK26DRAFT_5281 [Humicola hyalothermophila]
MFATRAAAGVSGGVASRRVLSAIPTEEQGEADNVTAAVTPPAEAIPRNAVTQWFLSRSAFGTLPHRRTLILRRPGQTAPDQLYGGDGVHHSPQQRFEKIRVRYLSCLYCGCGGVAEVVNHATSDIIGATREIVAAEVAAGLKEISIWNPNKSSAAETTPATLHDVVRYPLCLAPHTKDPGWQRTQGGEPKCARIRPEVERIQVSLIPAPHGLGDDFLRHSRPTNENVGHLTSLADLWGSRQEAAFPDSGDEVMAAAIVGLAQVSGPQPRLQWQACCR